MATGRGAGGRRKLLRIEDSVGGIFSFSYGEQYMWFIERVTVSLPR
jgi:hypothetical protein